MDEKLEQLIRMGFDQDIAVSALKAHPNSMDSAVDYCCTPPIHSDNFRRPISPPRPNSPNTFNTGPDSQNYQDLRNLECRDDRDKQDKFDQVMAITSHNLYSSNQGYTTSSLRSSGIIDSENTIDLTNDTSASPPNRRSMDSDPDMAKALSESLKGHFDALPNNSISSYADQPQPNYTPYSSSYPAHNTYEPIPPLLLENGPNNQNESEEEKGIREAISASLNHTLADLNEYALEIPGARVERLKSPIDRVRDPKRPVAIRTDWNQCTPLANYIQALYSIQDWRKAILECPLPLGNTDSISFAGYWKGLNGVRSNLSRPEQNLMKTFQVLFAFLAVTKRSFVSLGSDFLSAIECGDMEYSNRQRWNDRIHELHQKLVDSVLYCTKSRIEQQAEMEDLAPSELNALLLAAHQRFEATGRAITNDKFVAGPLAPQSIEETIARRTATLRLEIPFEPKTGNLYALLDEVLVLNAEGGEELQLFNNLPKSLIFQLNRPFNPNSMPQHLTTVDSPPTERALVQIEKVLFFDRYAVPNRGVISKGRDELRTMKSDLEGLLEKRNSLAFNADGESAIEMITASLDYFKELTNDSIETSAQKTNTTEYLSKVLEVITEKITGLDVLIEETKEAAKLVFENDSMKKYGPFELTAILMGTGLDGWISNWAIIRGDDGTWYKTNDSSLIPIDIDVAINDRAGIRMDCGAAYLIYQQLQELEIQVPQYLIDSVENDNINFARELPAEITSEWGYDLSQPELVQDDSSFEFIGSAQFDQASPIAIAIEIADVAEASHIVDSSSQVPTSPASIAESASSDSSVLRIRGGASGELEFEEGDELDGMDEDEVELGCLAPMTSDWNVDLAVGKVGGKPKWIDPSSPLEFKDVECAICGSTMSSLLQMNSPDDDHEHAAARTLYIFSCRNSSCLASNATKSMKVFRTQMESPNEYYPHTLESIVLRSDHESKLDATTQLGGSPPADQIDRLVWTESNIVCEAEPYEESYLDDGTTPTADSNDDDEDNEDARAPDTAVGVDTPFLVFQERISRLPEQVLRFYRLPEVANPQPLWISSDKISANDLPLCALCGAPKAIEFQIISTILNHLNDSEFQFDTILIYTCTMSCLIPPRGNKTGWTEETLITQTFEKGGVKFGRA